MEKSKPMIFVVDSKDDLNGRAFMSGHSGKATEKDPMVFVLHQNDEGAFILTQHAVQTDTVVRDYEDNVGKRLKSRLYRFQKGFIDRYEGKNSSVPAVYVKMFKPTGMFGVTPEQAQKLTKEPYSEECISTLKEIQKTKNYANLEVNAASESLKQRILDKDFDLAYDAFKQHNKEVKKREAETQQQEVKANSTVFGKLFKNKERDY